MSIRVRCPRCWETAEVSEKDLGKQGICNSCGSVVTIPHKLTKVCFICGADVTHVRHAKDPDNNYLCQSCWQARNPVQRAMFSVPALECSACHARLSESDSYEHDGRTLCRNCWTRMRDGGDEAPAGEREAKEKSVHPLERVHDDREEHHAAAGEHHAQSDAHAQPAGQDADGEMHWNLRRLLARRSAGSPVAVIMACLALAASAVLAVMQFGDSAGAWEREHHAEIIALKAQAEILVAVGKVREGVEKYNELLRLVNGRRIRSEALNGQIRAAQAAAEIASKTVVDTWEEEYRPRIMVMRGQAEVLSALGRHREAADKYSEILRLAGGRMVRSALLAEELRLARAGVERELAAGEAERHAESGSAAVVSSSSPPPAPGPVTTVAQANNTAPATQPAAPAAVAAGAGNGNGTAQTQQPASEQPQRPQAQSPQTDAPARPPVKSIFDF